MKDQLYIKLKNKKKFFYSKGCGGNGNKFNSLTDCRALCSDYEPTVESSHEGGGHGMALPVRMYLYLFFKKYFLF